MQAWAMALLQNELGGWIWGSSFLNLSEPLLCGWSARSFCDQWKLEILMFAKSSWCVMCPANIVSSLLWGWTPRELCRGLGSHRIWCPGWDSCLDCDVRKSGVYRSPHASLLVFSCLLLSFALVAWTLGLEVYNHQFFDSLFFLIFNFCFATE